MSKAELKTPEILWGAQRQHRHNYGSEELIPAFDFDETVKIVTALQERLKQAEERVRELEGLVKKYKLAVDAQKDVIKALQGKE